MQTTKLWLAVLVVAMLVPVGTAWGGDAPAASAREALDRLKAMEGTWVGLAKGEGTDGMEVTHEFKVSAAGTVVMETMNPGSGSHEMINMYHLDGEELVLTHYCAGGNQPTMKLDRTRSGATELHFDFTGGSNLDPAKDGHIHSASIVFNPDGSIDSHWTSWFEGREAGAMRFVLSRGKS